MAKYKATNPTNPFSTSSTSTSSTADAADSDITATADAHSTFDVETIGENELTAADLAAEKMASDDMIIDSMGTPSETFAPVDTAPAAMGVGGENPFDTTTPVSTNAAPPAPVMPTTPPAPLPSASELASTAKDKASDVAGQAKDAAGQAVEQAKAAAGQATDQIKAQTQEAFTQTKQVAGEALGKAKENVVSQLETQLDRATDSIGGLTAALRQTGEQFKGQNIPFVPDYAEQFAGQLDKVSEYLKQNDVEQLARDAESFARRNPALFIGGAFLLGIGIARFIKASGASAVTASAYNPDNLPARISDVTPSVGADTMYTGEMPTGAMPPERQDIFTDDAIPSGKVMSAHNYVSGVGVSSGE